MAALSMDQIFRRIIRTKFFTNGWGSEEQLVQFIKFRRVLGNRKECAGHVDEDHSIVIDQVQNRSDHIITSGHFTSPIVKLFPDLLPKESQNCQFELITPSQWASASHNPVCVHLAGTGDHGSTWRRKQLAYPLLKNGIGSVIVENPFYGVRKPPSQLRSGLLHVNDIFVLGGTLAMESLVLLRYCDKLGLGPLGVSGVSLGGHNAALAGLVWPEPLVIVPCLNGLSGASIFSQGVLARTCKWTKLEEELKSYRSRGIHHLPAHLMQQIDGVKLLSDDGRVYEDTLCPESNIAVASKFDIPSHMRNQDVEQLEGEYPECFQFMRWLMDEVSHLQRMEVPVPKSRIINVLAKHDEYIPLCAGQLEDIWSDCETRYAPGGHVTSCLFNFHHFRTAIADAFSSFR